MSKLERIVIGSSDRDRLERLVRDRNTAQKVVWWARIVLLAAEGLKAGAIAATTGKSKLTVRRWRRRFLAKGVDGLLKDATRPPRRKPLTAAKIAEVVHLTLHGMRRRRPIGAFAPWQRWWVFRPAASRASGARTA
jgi:hypothetical protein